MADVHTVQAGGQQIAVRKDLRIPMRDGVPLAADAYSGIEDKPRPALVALSPYGKELQALALTMPPQRRPSPMWDGCIEAGDIARVVAEGYVHVIGDIRGSGGSEGEHVGNYNAGGNGLDNLIVGNSQDNVIDGATGADTMIGGKGNDSYFIDNPGDKVVEQAGEGIPKKPDDPG